MGWDLGQDGNLWNGRNGRSDKLSHVYTHINGYLPVYYTTPTNGGCNNSSFDPTYHIFVIGYSDSYERKGILSAPIFMDNVACYGSEQKLIDCTYHTDTTEDRHSNDIWINCNVTGASKPATQATSDTIEFTNPSAKIVTDESTTIPSIFGLGLALIALSITILAIIFLIGYIIVYRHKNKPHTNSK